MRLLIADGEEGGSEARERGESGRAYGRVRRSERAREGESVREVILEVMKLVIRWFEMILR